MIQNGTGLGVGPDRLRCGCEPGPESVSDLRRLPPATCRLLCCTLWTDFALLGDPGTAVERAAMVMPDYGRIRRAEGGLISPEDTVAIHRDHLDWLTREIARPCTDKPLSSPITPRAWRSPIRFRASARPSLRILTAGSRRTCLITGSSVIPTGRCRSVSAVLRLSTSRSAIPTRCPR